MVLYSSTLRPKTQYGQTCCSVGPKLSYGVCQVSSTEFDVCAERAARNMTFWVFSLNMVSPYPLAPYKASLLLVLWFTHLFLVHHGGIH
ncbi:hypothetical protein HOY82DRAFT_667419 [Tuber indicum]|nr:hypothetical protein HOY82DRAFT_667419 [Tuber indicum]